MCPAVGCVSPQCCQLANGCTGLQVCVVPGQSLGCPICMMVQSTCNADTDCGMGQICDSVACACSPATACTDGCSNTNTCPDGQVCGTGPHPRCQPVTCAGGAPCPLGFECGNVSCLRKTCTADADCGSPGVLFCVEGQCYRSQGTCEIPPQ
jgi:hypothetical protein